MASERSKDRAEALRDLILNPYAPGDIGRGLDQLAALIEASDVSESRRVQLEASIARENELLQEIALANRGKEAELAEAIEDTILAERAADEIENLRAQLRIAQDKLEASIDRERAALNAWAAHKPCASTSNETRTTTMADPMERFGDVAHEFLENIPPLASPYEALAALIAHHVDAALEAAAARQDQNAAICALNSWARGAFERAAYDIRASIGEKMKDPHNG